MHIVAGKMFAILLLSLVMANVLGAPSIITNDLLTVPMDHRYSNNHLEITDMANITETTTYERRYSNDKRNSSSIIYELTTPTFTNAGQFVYQGGAEMTRTSNCPSKTVAERSICPWRNDVMTEIPERSPSVFYEARCLSNTPKDVVDSGIRCVPVIVYFEMKYRNSSNVVTTVHEPHAVSCTPAFPCR